MRVGLGLFVSMDYKELDVKTGDKVRRSAIYRCHFCGYAVALRSDERFPTCRQCHDIAEWY
jgi:rubrerythrin